MFPRTLLPSICLNGCCVFCFIEANQRIETPAAWQVDWVLQGDFGWLLFGLGQGVACVCVWWTLASRIWLKSTRGQPYSDFFKLGAGYQIYQNRKQSCLNLFLLGEKSGRVWLCVGFIKLGRLTSLGEQMMLRTTVGGLMILITLCWISNILSGRIMVPP